MLKKSRFAWTDYINRFVWTISPFLLVKYVLIPHKYKNKDSVDLILEAEFLVLLKEGLHHT